MNYVLSIMYKKCIFFLLLVTCYLSLVTSEARAQAEVRTMTIVPPASLHTLDPGDTTEGTLKVINDSPEPITFTVTVRDFIVVDTRGTPNFLPPNTLNQKYSAASWIGVIPGTFTLNPGQKQDLAYYIQIPADARPGGHYAGAVYTATTSDAPEGSGTSVQTQIGTLFYLSINGDIKEQAEVSLFSTPSFLEYGPVTIETKIKNNSDLHITPNARIKVFDMIGREIQSDKLTPFNVFPEAQREYQNTFGQQWMVGRFKASLVGTYGKNNNLPLVASVTFWVFPWRVTLVAILIIVAIILGWKLWKKRGAHNTQTHTEQNTDQTRT